MTGVRVGQGVDAHQLVAGRPLLLGGVEVPHDRGLEGHSDIVRTLAFSPDGRTALSGGSDHAVILWDLEAGSEIRRFEGHDGWVRTVAFSPDGDAAVSGGFVGDAVSSVVNPGQLILWDLASGKEIRRFSGDGLCCFDIDMSPDGNMAITPGGGGTAILWDLTLPVEMDEAWQG